MDRRSQKLRNVKLRNDEEKEKKRKILNPQLINR